MTDIPPAVIHQYMRIFEDLGIDDPGVEGIEIRYYYDGFSDRVYAANNPEGNVTIEFTLAGRPEEYDGESVSHDERNDT